MLNILLSSSGARLAIISAGGSSLRTTDKVAEMDPALILISHIPPVGLTQARYLVKRMRARRPDTPIIVGYWERDAATPEATERFRPARLVSSLAAAREAVLERVSAPRSTPGPLIDASHF
jgi:hypothetical protein